MKHIWEKNSDGSIKEIQTGIEDYHTGPICVICGFSFCQDCNEDGWDDDTCPGPDEKEKPSITRKPEITPVPVRGFFVNNNPNDINNKYTIGPIKKIPLTCDE
jgi:hypothetical protein